MFFFTDTQAIDLDQIISIRKGEPPQAVPRPDRSTITLTPSDIARTAMALYFDTEEERDEAWAALQRGQEVVR